MPSGVFSVPIDHRVKMKESEKINMELNLFLNLKRLEHEGDGDANTAAGAFETVRKGSEKYWRNQKSEEES